VAQIKDKPWNKAVSGIDIQLAAKTSADFGSDHAHRGFRKSQHNRKLRAQQMWYLRGRPDGEAMLPGQIFGKDGKCLHRDRREALVEHALLHYAVGFFESGADVAVLQSVSESFVGAELVVDIGSVVAKSLLHVGDDGPWLVVGFHEFGGMAAGVCIVCYGC